MFGNNVKQFKGRVVASFNRVREDMGAFKRSVTDWILYLDSNQREMQQRIVALEREVEELKKQRLYTFE